MLAIHIEFRPKPIPMRQWDWEARYGDEELGQAVGHGATPEEALLDLQMQVDDEE